MDQPSTAADLENRAARIADPSIGEEASLLLFNLLTRLIRREGKALGGQ